MLAERTFLHLLREWSDQIQISVSNQGVRSAQALVLIPLSGARNEIKNGQTNIAERG